MRHKKNSSVLDEIPDIGENSQKSKHGGASYESTGMNPANNKKMQQLSQQDKNTIEEQ